MNKSTKIVREIIVKEIVIVKKSVICNFDTIMGDYKFAKCFIKVNMGIQRKS